MLTTNVADAQRGRRIDGGSDWTNSADFTTAQTLSTGLGVNFLGISLSELTINLDGSVSFGGSTISPFQTGGLTPGRMVINYSQTTDDPDNLLPPEIEAGFRANWEYDNTDNNNDTPPLNLFQLSLYQLLVGGVSSLVMEFNYESLAFEGVNPFIGYSVGGENFNLLETIASLQGVPSLSFAEYGGVGLQGNNTNLCPLPSPNALVCNNYNDLSDTFGPGDAVLPDFLDGYFNVNQSFGTPIIGRYFFQFPATITEPPVTVPEPGTLMLLLSGLVGAYVVRRRSTGSTQA